MNTVVDVDTYLFISQYTYLANLGIRQIYAGLMETFFSFRAPGNVRLEYLRASKRGRAGRGTSRASGVLEWQGLKKKVEH